MASWHRLLKQMVRSKSLGRLVGGQSVKAEVISSGRRIESRMFPTAAGFRICLIRDSRRAKNESRRMKNTREGKRGIW